MKIRTKFSLAFGTILLLVVIVAGVILVNIFRITSEFQNLNETQGRLTELADDIRYYDATLTDAVRAYLIDPQDQTAYTRYFEDAEALDNALKEAQRLATSVEDRQIFENIDRVNVELVAIEESLLAEPDAETAVLLYRGVYGELKAEYALNVRTFFDRQRASLQVTEDLILANLQQSLALIAVLVGALLLLSIVISLTLSRDILSRLLALTEVTVRFARGDLKARILDTSQDELGQLVQSFNGMAQTVQDRETSLEELNTSLDKRVQQRTVELEKATREAREASRLKDEFLAIMSHELRTPLNAIIGFLGILGMSGKLDDNSLHMTKRARANAERLLNLINDILDISRIESGRLQLVPTTLSVEMMVERARSQTSVLAEQKGLTFDIYLDEHMPKTLYADEDAVLKVMVNLLGNACKFTEQGEVNLRLLRQDQQWKIEVADTGIGIPPHMHEIIFERFRQVDGSSKRVHGGSGLGLAIVRQYVLTMGGAITVTSEPGHGSTFTVLLPLEETPTMEGEGDRVPATLSA